MSLSEELMKQCANSLLLITQVMRRGKINTVVKLILCLIKHHDIQYEGSGDTAPFIVNFGTRMGATGKFMSQKL